ncbi:hypothetical protein J5J10_06725 [Ciceribacter sp. L1K23]|uniref:hypothetical protein n=1 Tax=Ciceribacter sp. L1K23 TaxID=2820276 RepID=UPI001B82B428|nr:hypothetical protein [Ciceribacter sp. L1K23]MBR0555371.1 hypothetical protein [Ciceribacter sp. L1K23]
MGKTIAMVGTMTRLLCAIAMLSLGLAHTPPRVALAAFDTAALLLPDGTYADLCIGDEGLPHPGHDMAKCEACLIGGSTLLPLPDDESWLIDSFECLDNGLSDVVAHVTVDALSLPRSRGPPTFS